MSGVNRETCCHRRYLAVTRTFLDSLFGLNLDLHGLAGIRLHQLLDAFPGKSPLPDCFPQLCRLRLGNARRFDLLRGHLGVHLFLPDESYRCPGQRSTRSSRHRWGSDHVHAVSRVRCVPSAQPGTTNGVSLDTKKPGNSESQGGGGLKPFPGAIGSMANKRFHCNPRGQSLWGGGRISSCLARCGGNIRASPKRVNTVSSNRRPLRQDHLHQPDTPPPTQVNPLTQHRLQPHRHAGNGSVSLAEFAGFGGRNDPSDGHFPGELRSSRFQRITSSRISPRVIRGRRPIVSSSRDTSGTRRRTSSKSLPYATEYGV